MLEQTLAIIRNTFFESIRQPIVLVVLVIATIAIVLSNPLSTFTMGDDQRMLIDIGLATVFLCGALLAAFVASSVLTREIENKTALTVVSKPVIRPLFIVGKFLGVAGAMVAATLYMSFVFLMVEMHGVMQTVRDPVHVPVVIFGIGAVIAGVGIAAWCNYFYNKAFVSTAIAVTTPLLALAYFLSLLFAPDFSPQPISAGFQPYLWMAIGSLTIAILVLTAVAVAASTRLSQINTLVVTLGVFATGMLSDWLFGRRVQEIRDLWTRRASEEGLITTVEVTRTIQRVSGETTSVTETVEVPTVSIFSMAEGGELLTYFMYWIPYAVVPNFQTMLLIDALTQGHVIPASYVGMSMVYGLCCMAVALGVAIFLFQRREVG